MLLCLYIHFQISLSHQSAKLKHFFVMKSKQEIKSFQLILINESCLHFFSLMSKQIGNESGESFRILSNPYCQILIKTGLLSIKFVIVNNFHNIYAGRDRTNRQGRLLPGDGIIAYSLSCGRNEGEGGPADGNCKVDVDRMPVSVDRQADIRCRFYVLVGRSASFVRIHSVATASCYSDRIEPVFELLATIGRFGPAFCMEKRSLRPD